MDSGVSMIRAVDAVERVIQTLYQCPAMAILWSSSGEAWVIGSVLMPYDGRFRPASNLHR
jgi:hypothetical protein